MFDFLRRSVPGPTDIALCVLEGPHHAVDDKLLVFWRDLEQGAKAVGVYRLQQTEKFQPMLREVLRDQTRRGAKKRNQQNIKPSLDIRNKQKKLYIAKMIELTVECVS